MGTSFPDGDAQVACVAVSEIKAQTTFIGEAEKEGDRCRRKNVIKELESVCLPSEIGYRCSQLDFIECANRCPAKRNGGVEVGSFIFFSGCQLVLSNYSLLQIDCGAPMFSRRCCSGNSKEKKVNTSMITGRSGSENGRKPYVSGPG